MFAVKVFDLDGLHHIPEQEYYAAFVFLTVGQLDDPLVVVV